MAIKVIAKMAIMKAAYTKQQIYGRGQIMSALRVLAKQKNVSLEQEAEATRAAAKALAATLEEESVKAAVQAAAETFGHVGHQPCEFYSNGIARETSYKAAPTESAAIHEGIVSAYVASGTTGRAPGGPITIRGWRPGRARCRRPPRSRM